MLTQELKLVVYSFLKDSIYSLFREMLSPTINRCFYKTAVKFETRLNNKFDKVLVCFSVYKSRSIDTHFPILRKVNVDLLLPKSLQAFTNKKNENDENNLCLKIKTSCRIEAEETENVALDIIEEINQCVPHIFEQTRNILFVLRPVEW